MPYLTSGITGRRAAGVGAGGDRAGHGDCEILDELEFLSDPTAIGKPVNDPPAHVTLTADQTGVIERVFSAIGPAS